MSFYRNHGKRWLDVSVSAAGLIVTAPVLVAVAALVAAGTGGKVFHEQWRPGRLGKPFRIFKFKTMTDEVDDRGELLPDELRITRIGRFVRRSSIDELLQLANVLRGDMSLIGPRPLLIEYLPYYTPFEARRHEVQPGITGLAQVRGRNSISWRRRFRYDVLYVDRLSLMLDLKIALLTVVKVLGGSDIGAPEEKFRGSFRRRTAGGEAIAHGAARQMSSMEVLSPRG